MTACLNGQCHPPKAAQAQTATASLLQAPCLQSATVQYLGFRVRGFGSSSPLEQCHRRQLLCWRASLGGPQGGRPLHPPTALAAQQSLRPCAGSPAPGWPAWLPGHQRLYHLSAGQRQLPCNLASLQWVNPAHMSAGASAPALSGRCRRLELCACSAAGPSISVQRLLL